MHLNSISRRWLLMTVGLVVAVVAVWGLRAGYLPEIGRFFAYDPVGYVPLCAWHGEPITPLVQTCCGGFVPVTVQAGKLAPMPVVSSDTVPLTDTGSVATDFSLPTPTPTPTRIDYPMYCVQPGCEAVLRQVQCIQAPCDPVVEIICPAGVTPPPRPSYTPTPTPPQQSVYVEEPRAGTIIALGNIPKILWTTDAPYPSMDIYLYKRALGSGGGYIIARNVPNTGIYVWDTSLPVTRMTDGAPQDLSVIPGDDFFIIVQVSGEQASDASEDFSLLNGSPTPPPSISPAPYGYIGLSIRPESGDSESGAIDIRPGVPVPVQLFVLSNPGQLNLTAADIVMQTSTGLQITRFTPFDLTEILEPAQINQIPNGPSQLRVTVGSGTTPIGGFPILGTVSVVATKDATGYLELNLMGDTQLTAAGSTGNVLGGFSPRRFRVVASSKPGDVDGDGDVDIFDYNLVVTNFGGSGPAGDADGDGDVDIFDYNLVVTNFGK